MSAFKLERYDNSDDQCYIRVGEGTYNHTNYPHPLIGLDFDVDNQLIGIEILGPIEEVTLEAPELTPGPTSESDPAPARGEPTQ